MLSARTVKAWYRVHKWTSLICTAFLLMLCITGLPLVFAEEIGNIFPDPHVWAAAVPPGTPAAPLDPMISFAQRRYPMQAIQSVGWDSDEPRVFVNVLKPGLKGDQGHSLIFDAHTGRLLQEQFPNAPESAVDRVMDFVTSLHINLFAGLTGDIILCVAGSLFVASLVSGVVVYGPFMRRLSFGTVRMNYGRRTTWFDLHNLLGIVTLTWMLVVGATGVMNTLADPLFNAWQSETMPALIAPYKGHPMPPTLSSVDAAITTARRVLPGNKLSSVEFPTDPDPNALKSPRHYLIWSNGDTTLTSQLFTPILVDAVSGKLASKRGLPWYLRALEVSRPLHFGNYGGLPLKFLWAALDLMTIAVLCSGVYLWLSRRKRPFEARLDELERQEAAVFAATASAT